MKPPTFSTISEETAGSPTPTSKTTGNFPGEKTGSEAFPKADAFEALAVEVLPLSLAAARSRFPGRFLGPATFEAEADGARELISDILNVLSQGEH
jgi:hypothetical protein